MRQVAEAAIMKIKVMAIERSGVSGLGLVEL